jgi:undecaprenyl-diphosphatase
MGTFSAMRPRFIDSVLDRDEALFERVASAHLGALDRWLPRLSRAADHGVLWTGIALALAAAGTRGRRAAARGMTSLGVASALANGPLKWSFRRRRPDLVGVSVLRQLRRQPATTSFPSGHAASAAAFATGVAMQEPLVALPVAALATAVAYSRVHTGVHYPLDVAVGAGVGVGAALLVRRSWPVPPSRPAALTAAAAAAPRITDGTGLVLVANPSAGAAPAEDLRRQLLRELPAAEVVVCRPDDDVVKTLAEAAARAEVLGVAGGDGTVNWAANAALEHGVPLAVVPAGTLNHFAAELGIEDLDDLLRALRGGEAAEITVGSAAGSGKDRFFLNTFSVGVYPELVRRREARERWLGKWLSLSVALVEVLRHAEPLEVRLDGQPRRLWLLFGGNGRYHPPGFAPSWRESLDDDVIDLRLVDASSPWARSRLVAAVLSGRLGRSRVYEERQVTSADVRLVGAQELARDGEVEPAPDQLVLRTADRRLVVYRPAPP